MSEQKKFEFIEYKGLRVFVANFCLCKNLEEQLELINDSAEIVLAQPLESLYILNDWTGVTLTKEITDKLKTYSKEADKHVVARALMGLDPVKKIFVKIFSRMVRSYKNYVVNSREEGLELLYAKSLEQQQAA